MSIISHIVNHLNSLIQSRVTLKYPCKIIQDQQESVASLADTIGGRPSVAKIYDHALQTIDFHISAASDLDLCPFCSQHCCQLSLIW